MIDDFIRYLLSRHKYLGIIAVSLLIFFFILSVISDFQILSGLSPLIVRILVVLALLFLLGVAIVIVSENKGQYSSKERRWARIFVVLILILIIVVAWQQLKEQFIPLKQNEFLDYLVYIVAGAASLVWVVWMEWRDKRAPRDFTILVCEFSEGARKEIPTDRHITHTVLQNLRNKMVSRRVRIVHVEEVVLEHERAQILGRNAKAIAVLFGFYTKIASNVLLDIRFQVIKRPEFFQPIDVEQRIIPIDELDQGRLQLFLVKDYASLAYFLIGLFEYSGGNYKEAIWNFEAALQEIVGKETIAYEHSLGLDLLHLYLGNSYFLLGEYDAAKREFERALSHNQLSAKAVHNLGVLHYGASEKEQAIECFSKAIELDSGLLVAYRNKAFLLIEKEKYAEAEEVLVNYLDLQPNDVDAIHLLAICRSAVGDTRGAIDKYNSLLAINPRYHLVRLPLAEEHLRAGNYALAKKQLVSFVKRHGDESRSYSLRGDLLYYSEDYDEAISFYSRALKQDEENPELFFARGRANFACKDYIAAKQDFQSVVDLDPAAADAYFNLGNTHFRTDDLDLAISSYSKALELVPDHTSSLFNRGHAYYKSGLPREAASDFERYIGAVKNSRKKSGGHQSRGMARLATKDFLGAIHDFEEALRYSPDRKDVESALAATHYSYAVVLSERNTDPQTICKHLQISAELNPSLKTKAFAEEQFQTFVHECFNDRSN